ncbi:anthranilate synthase family protein [Rhodococcus sp. IEGM 1330]|uniref:anthranilate synthase family protein n=1 Tax=Rhodococcus sp. IEGM 1330 TaxID=3082225 RepID=UPI002954A336|nr:anthranilate synthase family protein [Rhodococcus sp. IEGM 1330]MDV8022667.1 anthranilate synthase family protein [Rhodococcus sp. IEGM 1330]
MMRDEFLLSALDTRTPFALIEDSAQRECGNISFFSGPTTVHKTISSAVSAMSNSSNTSVILVPFRQVSERGFDCIDDGTPLITIDANVNISLVREDLLKDIDAPVPEIRNAQFDVSDIQYQDDVRAIVEEIKHGAGANFVLARSLKGYYESFSSSTALGLFKQLLLSERESYWTFCIFTGTRFLVGSTPEQHFRLTDGVMTMNPISGTLRPSLDQDLTAQVLEFLRDDKEVDELNMVVDEELKMMAELCTSEIRVSGPFLRSMSRVIHTEFQLSGRTSSPLSDLIGKTMFAPAVTGSPLRSALTTIARRERRGRGYYSGIAGVYKPTPEGYWFDSSIIIRTADITTEGLVRVTAGATIVRDSNPAAEAVETADKISHMIQAAGQMRPVKKPQCTQNPEIMALLARRTHDKAKMWLDGRVDREPAAQKVRVAVINAEDSFTSMISYQLRHIGFDVEIFDWHNAFPAIDSGRVVLFGPGPGDPTDESDQRVAHLRHAASVALSRSLPIVGICLGHQIIASTLGLEIRQLEQPVQGRQISLSHRGVVQKVGFYNSFTVSKPTEFVYKAELRREIVVSLDEKDDVVGMSGGGVSTVQFHPESFFTEYGPRILLDLVQDAVHSLHEANHGSIRDRGKTDRQATTSSRVFV